MKKDSIEENKQEMAIKYYTKLLKKKLYKTLTDLLMLDTKDYTMEKQQII